MFGRARFLALSIALPLVFTAANAARAEVPYSDVSLFTISKSENRNEVQYAIRLDAQCAPIDATPVFAFWRMHEKGANVFEPLLGREQPAYGIGAQSITWQNGTPQIRISLRALPGRTIVVQPFRSTEGCGARAEMTIAAASAQLTNVHAMLAWPFGVDKLIVTGLALADRRALRETIRP
jgi:hypothetical protein